MDRTVQIITKADLDRMIADPYYKATIKLDVQPRPAPPVNTLYIMTMDQVRALALRILIRQKKHEYTDQPQHHTPTHRTLPLPKTHSRYRG